MNHLRSATTVFLLFFLIFTTQAQDIKIGQKKALEDLQQFRKQIEQTHPALFQYQTEAAWNASVLKVEEQLRNMKDISLRDFFWHLNSLCVQIQSAETQVDIITAAEKAFMGNARFFPHRLIFEKGETFVYHSSDSNFIHGLKVQKVNGKKMDELFKELLPLIPTDGNNNSHRMAVLEEQFGFYHMMRYGASESFELTGIDFIDKKTHGMKHDALTHPYLPQVNTHKGEDLFSLIGESHDVVWVDLYAMKDPHELDGLKEKLKGFESDKVVVDLRNFHNDYFEAFWPLIHIFGYEPENRFYQMTCREKTTAVRYPNHPMNTIKPEDYKFCILVDGESGELANMLAGMAMKFGTGYVVGDETGANELKSQVRPLTFTLKNSGFALHVPTCNFSLLLEENPLPDRGLFPEYIVHPTWEEIVTEDDGPLNFCVRLLTGKLLDEEQEDDGE